MPSATPTRDVVSFVRRSPRMNPSQQRAWDAHHDWIIALPPGERETSVPADARVDWDAAFGRRAPLLVEIGSGTGDALVALATARPEANLLAFEVFLPAVASTLGSLARAGADNARLVVADGVAGLETLFDPGSISELTSWFPDPWPKMRHHKRRLVNAAFAALVASRLAPDGVWRLATDSDDYARTISEVLAAQPALVVVHDGDGPRPDLRPVTRFEGRAREAGRTIHEFECRRR